MTNLNFIQISRSIVCLKLLHLGFVHMFYHSTLLYRLVWQATSTKEKMFLKKHEICQITISNHGCLLKGMWCLPTCHMQGGGLVA